MEPSDEFLKLSPKERLETLRGTPWIRTRWLYLVLMAIGLDALTIWLLAMAAIEDDSTFVGFAVLAIPPGLFLSWLSWVSRAIAGRRGPTDARRRLSDAEDPSST